MKKNYLLIAIIGGAISLSAFAETQAQANTEQTKTIKLATVHGAWPVNYKTKPYRKCTLGVCKTVYPVHHHKKKVVHTKTVY